jgi:urease accessory protein
MLFKNNESALDSMGKEQALLLSTLSLLQFGDSQFPSGSFAFSGGLEALFNDQKIRTPTEVMNFISAQLQQRWNSLDRVALCRCYRLGDDLDAISAIDHEVDAMTLAAGLRVGSCRNGAALLSIHARLETHNSAEYRRRLQSGQSPGHIAVIQGLLWRHCGLSEIQSQAASAHAVCSDLLGAAMRLGKLGHLHAQLIRQQLTPVIATLLEVPVSDHTEMHSYLPATEIAAMRHESSKLRLFSN